jgi:hypothetical protein
MFAQGMGILVLEKVFWDQNIQFLECDFDN